MQARHRWIPWSLALTAALLLLPACRRQTPPSPEPPRPTTEAPVGVTSGADARAASDHPDAAPAIGALTAGQASGGARQAPIQPTAGDGTRAGTAASSPASGVSSPR